MAHRSLVALLAFVALGSLAQQVMAAGGATDAALAGSWLLTADSVIGLPGQKVLLTAQLTIAGRPAPTSSVSFKVAGAAAGSGRTDAGGTVSVEFTVPETFVQKAYPLAASARLERGARTLNASAKLAIFKAATELVLGDLGSPPGWYTLSLRRKHDHRALHRQVEVVVNGAFYNHVDGSTAMLPLPADGTTWKVDASFVGTASYLPCTATKTYRKP